jgi:hypothetical protein
MLRRVLTLSACCAALALTASPTFAQGRNGGFCPPGQAKKGRCGDIRQSQRDRNGDWCLDRNRDSRCDNSSVYDQRGVYDRRRDNDHDADDGVYNRRQDNGGYTYGRDGRVYDRNGRVIDDGRGHVVRDRNGNIVYDRNGNPVYDNAGKAQVRSTVGGLLDELRRRRGN